MLSSTNIAPLNDHDFDRVRELAHTACGLNLEHGKRALVSSRLERLVRRNGFGAFTSYLTFLSQRKSSEEFTEFIDTLTTNHSGFWREPEHFQFLQKNIMPEHRHRLRIWSAACATGEEPYTIAMCALESGVANCHIAASDISRTALRAAVRGIYETSQVSLLPSGWRSRYFQTNASEERPAWRIADHPRALVNFSPLNLLHSFTQLGTFDVIFCRNVMIYFDQQTRNDLVVKLAGQLAPGGHLFTGHSETLLSLPPNLQYLQPATYRKC